MRILRQVGLIGLHWNAPRFFFICKNTANKSRQVVEQWQKQQSATTTNTTALIPRY